MKATADQIIRGLQLRVQQAETQLKWAGLRDHQATSRVLAHKARIKELEAAIEAALQERSDYFIHLILKEVMQNDI